MEICYNIYFETDRLTFDDRMIGLLAAENAVVNNINDYNCNSQPLLSVTVVNDRGLDANSLENQIISELRNHISGLTGKKPVAHFHIKKALPDIPKT